MPLPALTPILNGTPADASQVDGNFDIIAAYFDNDIADAIVERTPPGAITMYGGAAAPTGWLLCDGASLLRASYPDLFTTIGTTYGAADATHFNVPNLAGRIPIGPGGTVAAALAATGGSKDAVVVAHTHTGPSHTHSIDHDHASASTSTGGAHTHNYEKPLDLGDAGGGTGATRIGISGGTATTSDGSHSHTLDLPNFTGTSGSGGTGATGSTGASGTNANLPPYIALNFIIRT